MCFFPLFFLQIEDSLTGAYSSGHIDGCRILNEKELSGCGFLDSAWTKNKASSSRRDLAQPSACKGSCFPWLCLSGHFPWQKFLKALEIFEGFPPALCRFYCFKKSSGILTCHAKNSVGKRNKTTQRIKQENKYGSPK